MSWWGKIIGGGLGFLLGGPLGGLLGAALGHNLDQSSRMSAGAAGFGPGVQERVQGAFFTATFSVMGHIAKADGHVSREEIDTARAVMDQLNLSPAMQKAAQRLFSEGKQAGFPLDEVVEQLRVECHRRHTLLQMFLEIQLHAAYADGVLHPAEHDIIQHIAEILRFSTHELAHLETMVKAQRHAGGGRQAGLTLEEAYAVLDVTANAGDKEVKRAYRRLMNQHHPDKLVAKGLPEEMMLLAKEKTQDIKAAWDVVKQARKLK